MFRTQNDMTAQFSPKKSQCKYTDSPCKKSQVIFFPKYLIANMLLGVPRTNYLIILIATQSLWFNIQGFHIEAEQYRL